MKTKKREKEGLLRSIFVAHIIVLLHILILAGVGLTIILFRGVYLYLPWIIGGIGILLLLTAWFFYRQIRNSTSDIHTILAMPQYQDRAIEVNLIGGLASFKLNAPGVSGPRQLSSANSEPVLLENKIQQTEEKIYTLTALYEKNVITKAEFETAKEKLIQG